MVIVKEGNICGQHWERPGPAPKPAEKGLMGVLDNFEQAILNNEQSVRGGIVYAYHAILNEFERMAPEPPLDVIESYMGSELAGQAYTDGWNAVIKGFKSKIKTKRERMVSDGKSINEK